ncbi:MAG: glutaredoxin family protein [Bryobacterales bacterium]|nr:glutaredoxin family protein [Bryobacterales bacterium]
MRPVTLYSRPGCRLCAEARRELELACPGLQVDEVDVDSDPALRERYGLHIPVAVAGGRELFRHRFTEAALRLLQDG